MMTNWLRFIITLSLLITLIGCSGVSTDAPQEPIDILFIGDSFTVYPNAHLPDLFTSLAVLGDHQVNVSSVTRNATSLAFHLRNKNLVSKIDQGNLDYVVLQEWEVLPSVPEDRDAYMFPAVRKFDQLIRENDAQPILYMTWGYKDGFPEAGHETYASMQEAIAESNLLIAEELGLPVAPVGLAWQLAVERDLEIDLWIEDGGHSTAAGMYLAASVFYAFFFREDPTSIPYSDEFGIDEETVQFLYGIANEVVLENPDRWNLP